MSKKIHNNDILGQQGINLIEQIVLDMGFMWYPTGGVEAGIDGTIETQHKGLALVDTAATGADCLHEGGACVELRRGGFQRFAGG